MPVGSSYSTVKAAIVSKLQARPALSAVAVRYQAPEKASESLGENGSGESIYLDTAEGDNDNVVFGGLPLRLDETYTLTLVVQVLRPSTDGTQQAADRRVDELLFEVLYELATDPTFGIEPSDAGPGAEFSLLEITRADDVKRTTGYLSSGGHGADCELSLQVTARLSFSGS